MTQETTLNITEHLEHLAEAQRNVRQQKILRWAVTTFGADASTEAERITRFAEEAVELAQAAGLDKGKMLALVEHVYGKPVGERAQEVGGVGLTLLAYCEAAGLSAEAEERREWARALAFPADQIRKRQNAKADAGLGIRAAVKTCNKHDDCEAADARSSHPTKKTFHCHDVDCTECSRK
jgi:NTP pyrophosphatase (non-canonical NTP hydrolase)